MQPFRLSSFFILFVGAALAARAQSTPIASPPAPTDHVVDLDRVVVSSGFQDKTAFDLAQGTSILAGDPLHRKAQATLGDSLAEIPGVNSTYYGPGASRPIIRGLGGDRIR